MNELNKGIPDTVFRELAPYLQIRYVKLHFELEMLEDGFLLPEKASALRGGMGQMLMKMNCMFDGDCNACGFRNECIVQRIMYAEMKRRPSFMTGKDSEGYVLECGDYGTFYQEGGLLKFNLLLFGGCIAYFSQILQSFCLLGTAGLGKEHIPFRVRYVKNTVGDILYDGDEDLLDKERYQVLHVADYVEYRLRNQNVSDVALLRFHSPVSLKYRGQFQNKFNLEAIMAAIERRIFIMNCFEGTFRDETNQRISTEGHIPCLIEESVRFEKKPRYSGAQDKKTCFYGITGTCRISDIDKHALILLLAGELLHIGKNTSFGFGRYTLI